MLSFGPNCVIFWYCWDGRVSALLRAAAVWFQAGTRWPLEYNPLDFSWLWGLKVMEGIIKPGATVFSVVVLNQSLH